MIAAITAMFAGTGAIALLYLVAFAVIDGLAIILAIKGEPYITEWFDNFMGATA
jgi:hypothetical protein